MDQKRSFRGSASYSCCLCCSVAQGGTSREAAHERDSGQRCRDGHGDDYSEPCASRTRSHNTIIAREELWRAISQAKPPDDCCRQHQRHRDGGQDGREQSEAQEPLRDLAAGDCEAQCARAGDCGYDERTEKDARGEKHLPCWREMIARVLERFQEKSCTQENREGQDGDCQEEQGAASLLRESGPDQSDSNGETASQYRKQCGNRANDHEVKRETHDIVCPGCFNKIVVLCHFLKSQADQDKPGIGAENREQ